jgi:hypothetical protein
MCFSAQADIAGGVIAGAIGIDALRHLTHKGELALASLPLLFGAHQLAEVFVWWGLSDKVPWSVGSTAVWLYLVFAFVVLPVLVPMAIIVVEPASGRRDLMIPLAAIGVVVAVIYVVAILTRPVGAEISGHTIIYFNHLGESGLVNTLYVLACCGALVLSSHRHIVIFGLVNLAAVAVLLWVSSRANTSLWCAWAALTSVAIAAHLRLDHRSEPQPQRSRGLPA